MSSISTHVLDLGSGTPASGMRVVLWAWREAEWERLAELTTDDDGRVERFLDLDQGRYRLGFETGEWGHVFHPFVHIVFEVEAGHYHVPLLLSPYGYATYRGS